MLALQLAVATATGRWWIGREVKSGPVLFISAEDDDDELHRRLFDIANAEGIGMAALAKLATRSLAGEDALLAMLDRKSNSLVQTPLMEALDATMTGLRPELLVLDTLADLHSGEENCRAHARQFVGMLRGLAIRHSCAVLLLAHPSLTGLSSGTGLSGSTAWNASVRSRLYLQRITTKGDDSQPVVELDPDARMLRTVKANYGRTGEEIRLRWSEGVFEAEPGETGLDRMAGTAKAERVFLQLLVRFTEEGRNVNHAGGRYYAPKCFAEHQDSENVSKRAFTAAMNALFAAKRIAVENYGPPSRGTTRIVEVQAHA